MPDGLSIKIDLWLINKPYAFFVFFLTDHYHIYKYKCFYLEFFDNKFVRREKRVKLDWCSIYGDMLVRKSL
ncbi:MAG: hypothetical protein ACFFHD_00505 [Promethearchaeota archaeon]